MICIEVLFHSRPQPISHLDPREIYTWISPKFMLIKGIFFTGYTVGTEANCSQFLCCRPGTYRFEIPFFFCILKTAAEVYITKIQRMGKKKWLRDYNEAQILQPSLKVIVIKNY